MASYQHDTIKVGDKIYEATEALCGDGGKVETESIVVTPKTTAQTILPSEDKLIDKVDVTAVDRTIDINIQPENIKKGVDILGVEGNIISSVNENEVYFTNETGSGSIIGHVELDDTYDLYGYTSNIKNEYYTSNYTFLKNKKTGETEKILDIGFQQFARYNEDIICLSFEGRSNVIYNYKTKQTIFSFVDSTATGGIYITANAVIFSGGNNGRAVKIYSFTENKEIQYTSSNSYLLECLKIDEHRILFSDYYLPIFDDRTNSFTNLSTTSTNILRFDDNKEIIEFNNDKYFCRFDGKIYRVNNEFTELKSQIACGSAISLRVINNNLYVCSNLYNNGAFYKVDTENNTVIKMKENLNYCNLCITNGTNAIIFNSTKNQFFNGETETFTDLGSTGIKIFKTNEAFNRAYYSKSYLILDENNVVYLDNNSKCDKINLETGEEIRSSINIANTNKILKGKDYLLVFGSHQSTATEIFKIKISDMSSTTTAIMQNHGCIIFKQINNKYYIYQGLTDSYFFDTYVVSTFDITTDEFKLYKIGSIDYI